MRRPRTILVRTTVEVALLVGLYLLLVHLLCGSSVVATLLSAGPHSAAGALVLAGAFILVRLLVVLVLPGFVLYRLARALFAWRATP